MDYVATMVRRLYREMRRGTKTIEADPHRRSSCLERSPADKAGAQKRRGLLIAVVDRQTKHEPGVGDRLLRIAAVDLVARETRMRTKILFTTPAEFANTTRPTEPRHANPLAQAE